MSTLAQEHRPLPSLLVLSTTIPSLLVPVTLERLTIKHSLLVAQQPATSSSQEETVATLAFTSKATTVVALPILANLLLMQVVLSNVLPMRVVPVLGHL